MRIAILDLTTLPDAMQAGLPTAGALIEAWLAPALPEAQFTRHAVAQEAAPLPALETLDGVVLSGSELGVYDQTPWMEPLRAYLDTLRAARLPVYGICFGHQIMADTWGGRAQKAASGLAVGARSFEIEGRATLAHLWHGDQVTEVPPEATVTARAAHCPVGALVYDFPARSVQFHPEFTLPYLRALLAGGRGSFIEEAEADAALASMNGTPVDPDLEAEATAAFFRGAGGS